MGLSKTEKFTAHQNELAIMSKALGHPARIAILEYLLKANTCICGDIVGELGLAQATVSQHLKELKNLGIIKGNIEGTSTCYCIDSDKWESISDSFSHFFAQRAACSDDGCC
ncbi:MAG: metalloregulator ArsR/SmtB family transcription factor [Reichenbachiella sp.]|uniref:ArsR/SmtB family transcription factor n=1 Tax=Reichenbachiella sp. TaxID=2184521 RepID=UPI0032982660